MELNMGSNSEKVGKAVQFLAFPDIRDISSDVTKAKFLKSQGLNHDEVKEAFIRHYVASETNTSQLPVSSIQLNPVSGDHVGTVAVVQNTQSGSALSKFFSFCQRIVLFAGIMSSFYYAYQKWARAKDAKRKSEKSMRDEINLLRNELTKISSELRHYQLLERNNATLLQEVNSLKAILVGRQQFEEKQAGKVALPSWQLSGVDAVKRRLTSDSLNKPNETIVAESTSSCSTDKVVESNTVTNIENSIPVTVSLPSENDVCSPKKTPIKNGLDRPSEQQQSNSCGVKETKKNGQKSNNIVNEQKPKKNEKKN